MKITVNGQAERFWLAFKGRKNKWKEGTGHRITIGEFDFAAIIQMSAIGPLINVSEVSTGASVMKKIPDMDVTETKNGTIKYLKEEIAPIISNGIIKMGVDQFRKQVEELQNDAVNLLGAQPPIVEVDTDKILREMEESL